MSFQQNIEEIIENDNFSISEKLSKLDNLALFYKEKIKQTKEDLIKDYRYCYSCKDYYKKKFWDEGTRSVTRQYCTNPLMGYLDEYKYETVTDIEKYFECPKGHKIIDDYGC